MSNLTPPASALPAWINRGEPYWPIDIAAVERRKNATYMGDFCLLNRYGLWTDEPCAVFWNETPPDPDWSQYFGLHVHENQVFIVGAGSAAEGHWNALVANDGEVIYSRYVHDCRRSGDGSAIVDGGRTCFKAMCGTANLSVRITLVRDRLIVNDTLMLPYAPCADPPAIDPGSAPQRPAFGGEPKGAPSGTGS